MSGDDRLGTADPARPPTAAVRPWWRWLFVVPGLAAVGHGAVGLLGAGDDVPLGPWAAWFVGSALAHDLVVAPLVVAVGAVLARVLPRPARGPVTVGLVVSAVLAPVGLLFAINPGGAREPGFLPMDHGRNLALLVGATTAVALAWAAVAVLRDRRRVSRAAPTPSRR